MKTPAIYARVSTADQAHDSQMLQLEQYVANRCFTRLQVFKDIVSGGTKSRPGLDKLLAAARRRELSMVVVYRLDRLSRSLEHLVSLVHELDELGVQLVSLHEQIDTTTATGRLIFHVFGALAEFQRDLIRENVRAGIAAARAKGVRIGRPAGIEPGSESAARVLELRAARWTWEAIAAEVGQTVMVCRAFVRRAGNAKNDLCKGSVSSSPQVVDSAMWQSSSLGPVQR